MAGFFDCGFSRVAVKLSYQDSNGKPVMNKQLRYERYQAYFGENCDESFIINNNLFNARSTNLLKAFKMMDSSEKAKYMEHFSSAAWSKLSATKGDTTL